jgi:lysozyme family protein
MNFEDLKDEYSRLWVQARITEKFDAAATNTANKILASKARYQAIEMQTGVPWYVVGVIHAMESGCRFSTHLHNGDPLTAKTRRVPKARPLKGTAPFTWEESACDALLMKDLQHITDWTVERVCYELERYNGFGYRKYHPETLSPYLWSGTQHYARGKYVSDGKWDASAVSGQTGAIALIKRIDELDDTIELSPVVEPELVAQAEETSPTSYAKAEEKGPISQVAAHTANTVATTGLNAAVNGLPKPPPVVADSLSTISAWQGLGRSMSAMGTAVISSPAMIALVLCLLAAMLFGSTIMGWFRK